MRLFIVARFHGNILFLIVRLISPVLFVPASVTDKNIRFGVVVEIGAGGR